MSTNSVGGTNSNTPTAPIAAPKNPDDPFNSMDMGDFLKLMITQLQNQDPTKPLDNSDLFNQIGQLESIESSARLNDTLQSLALGQGLSNAGALIGKQVQGLDDNGAQASGTVLGVLVQDGSPKLVVGNQAISLSNIAQIVD